MRILSILLVLLLSAASLRAAGLPDPVRFSNVIELGDVSQAREWLDAGLAPQLQRLVESLRRALAKG